MTAALPADPLPWWARGLKRTFDLGLAVVGLALTWWLMLLAYAAACIDTRQGGLFTQQRVGRHGRLFTILKIRTMRHDPACARTVTVAGDPRVTRLGAVLRRTKIDELPQLVNILLGQMSFVGPRPDVPGYADRLQGDDRIILAVRPGITGPATLKYRNEERLLAADPDPLKLHDEVIYRDKVRLNGAYVREYTFRKDIQYILQTLMGK
jgi:lipopolysaccharide/colanic/teichoic acid biosynthesis glycosyltransferase